MLQYKQVIILGRMGNISIKHVLNVKIIIFSYDNYKEGDLYNVLKCHTSKNDYIFQPDYYIMLQQRGKHYHLIEYNNKLIHSFDEIPMDVKNNSK